ncbi:MAG: PilZ domain-containing protein [Anaerolineales bacterium]|nr:PilZ domain-containing protein [Anaerolineales bacterium]
MASNQQILSDLRLIMEADHALELLTNYKGVPFICKAKIGAIGADNVSIQAQDPAMICLLRDKQIRVLGSDYFEPSVAQIDSFDLFTGKAVLSDFSYLGTKLGERMIVRVEPKSPIDVHLKSEGLSTAGPLIDLSINGLGLRIGQADYSPTLKPGTSIQVNMQLPSGEISSRATVLSVVRTNEYYRLSMRFAGNDTQKKLIFQYLVDRRTEIEEELKDEYERALRAAGATS